MGDTIERVRERETTSEPEKKVETPKQHQVIYHQPPGSFVGCAFWVLRDIFAKSHGQAEEHLMEGYRTGQSIVLVTTADVAATKAAAANDAKQKKECGTFCPLVGISFSAEPAP